MYYLIGETLREVKREKALSGTGKYVAVISGNEWKQHQDDFRMGIDLTLDLDHSHTTKAVVNIDSLTGSFSVPQQNGERASEWMFALDERGIVFIDDDGLAGRIVSRVAETKKWKIPSLERFIYDFLEYLVEDDLSELENIEGRLDVLEAEIMKNAETLQLQKVNDIRWQLLTLRMYYAQLVDLSQELSENENEFFDAENLRYFEMFKDRVSRLQDYVTTLRDYSTQVRDLYQSQLSAKQNTIMTILTVVTVIFTPLTLITGWYGMNFRYMPELEYPYSYPIVFIVCLLIAVWCLIYLKKKKWL